MGVEIKLSSSARVIAASISLCSASLPSTSASAELTPHDGPQGCVNTYTGDGQALWRIDPDVQCLTTPIAKPAIREIDKVQSEYLAQVERLVHAVGLLHVDSVMLQSLSGTQDIPIACVDMFSGVTNLRWQMPLMEELVSRYLADGSTRPKPAEISLAEFLEGINFYLQEELHNASTPQIAFRPNSIRSQAALAELPEPWNQTVTDIAEVRAIVDPILSHLLVDFPVGLPEIKLVEKLDVNVSGIAVSNPPSIEIKGDRLFITSCTYAHEIGHLVIQCGEVVEKESHQALTRCDALLNRVAALKAELAEHEARPSNSELAQAMRTDLSQLQKDATLAKTESEKLLELSKDATVLEEAGAYLFEHYALTQLTKAYCEDLWYLREDFTIAGKTPLDAEDHLIGIALASEILSEHETDIVAAIREVASILTVESIEKYQPKISRLRNAIYINDGADPARGISAEHATQWSQQIIDRLAQSCDERALHWATVAREPELFASEIQRLLRDQKEATLALRAFVEKHWPEALESF